MTKRCIFIVILTTILAFPCYCAVEPGTLIKLDANNYLTFEQIAENYISIKLKLTYEGKPLEWDLNQEKDRVGTLVYGVKYVNKDLVWIVSRLGRMVNAATLLNIPLHRVEKTFAGDIFRFSPDGFHVAHLEVIRNQAREPINRLLYIDDVMIFPKLEVIKFNGPLPENRRGREYVVDYRSTSETFGQGFDWKEDNLLFSVQNASGEESGRIVSIPKSADVRQQAQPLSFQIKDISSIELRTTTTMPSFENSNSVLP